MMKVSIGTQLKKFRMDQNYSQAEVAEKLNISRQTLSKWELDKSLPDLTLLKDLALIYDVSLDSLLELQKERIQILPVLNNMEVSEAIARKFSKEEPPLPEQVHFVYEHIICPLAEKAGFQENYLWMSVEKQLIIPYTYMYHAVTKDISKEFLELFSFYKFTLILLTTDSFCFLNVIDWLENQEFTRYSLAEMEFVTIGKMHEPAIDPGNSQAFGYKTKSGNFDYYKLSKKAAVELKAILKVLDPNQEYTVFLEKLNVLKFINKYRSRNKYKEK